MRREFTQKVKVQAFELAGGKCQTCGLKIRGGAEYDHVVPCALGGEASIENCAVLCSACHRSKTSGEDVPRISKAKRTYAKRIGAWKSAYPPIRSRGFPKRPQEKDYDIGDAIRGKRWKHIPGGLEPYHSRRKFKAHEIHEIRAASKAGEFQKDIALRYGVDQTAISAIVRRATYQHVT